MASAGLLLPRPSANHTCTHIEHVLTPAFWIRCRHSSNRYGRAEPLKKPVQSSAWCVHRDLTNKSLLWPHSAYQYYALLSVFSTFKFEYHTMDTLDYPLSCSICLPKCVPRPDGDLKLFQATVALSAAKLDCDVPDAADAQTQKDFKKRSLSCIFTFLRALAKLMVHYNP